MTCAKPIRRILIANRGEIAVRIIRTCRQARHRAACSVRLRSRSRFAGRAVSPRAHVVHRPGTAPARSYLQVDRRSSRPRSASGCDAIHPGYGFLSERAELAEPCRGRGASPSSGPPRAQIEAVGDKLRARDPKPTAAERAGGARRLGRKRAEARRLGERIGAPLLVKAVGGGGGTRHEAGREPRRSPPLPWTCQR